MLLALTAILHLFLQQPTHKIHSGKTSNSFLAKGLLVVLIVILFVLLSVWRLNFEVLSVDINLKQDEARLDSRVLVWNQ